MSRNVTNERDLWAQLPEALLYGPLSDKAVRVYGALRRHGDDPADCFPSHARIAELIRCAPRSIARPLAELETAGWITREARYMPDGRRTSDGYHIHLVPRAVTSSAVPPQENVGGYPADLRNAHPAPARDEREQVTTKESKGLNDSAGSSSRRMPDELIESGTAYARSLREALHAPKTDEAAA